MTDNNISTSTANTSDTPLLAGGTPPVSTQSLIEQAKEAALALKVENDRKEALILREEEAKSRAMLTGRSEAGYVPVQKSKDDIVKEEVNNLLAKTGLKI